MDIVNKETAVALKNAGFHQPIPEFGQAWYFDTYEGHRKVDLLLYLIVNINGLGDAKMIRHVEFSAGHISWGDDGYYAPTAAEILKELPSGYQLYHTSNGFACGTIPFGYDVDEDYAVRFTHANPAEACAAAYLDYHKTETEI